MFLQRKIQYLQPVIISDAAVCCMSMSNLIKEM